MTQPAASAAAPASAPATVGVMIATFNRLGNLKICLSHLERQTCRDFQVLVLVDGSTDGTVEWLENYRQTSPFHLQYVWQPNGGRARAKNQALLHMPSPLCLLLGDDIFPEPGCVASHLAFHLAHPAPSAAAVGYTRWDEGRQTVTPFMRWLDRDGVQFAYGALLAGKPATWEHFYSSNLSAKTRLLRDNPSSEAFDRYGFEDIELGYRLFRNHGLSVAFLRDAVAEHLHPATFLGTCMRAIQTGGAAYTFGQLWPEHQFHQPRGLLKRALLPLLTEQHVVLPVLRQLTNLVTRFWCPNPLLKPVIMLHERLGYSLAQAQAQAAGRTAHALARP